MENIAIFGKTKTGKTYLIKNKILPALKSFIIFDFTGEYSGLGVKIKNLNDLRKIRSNKYIFQPDKLENFDILIRSLRFLNNFYLIIDEAQNVSSAGYLPAELREIVLMGRHRNINYCVSSQRPARVSRDFTSNSRIIYFFKLTEPADLNFVNEFTDKNKVKNLKDHKFIKLNI